MEIAESTTPISTCWPQWSAHIPKSAALVWFSASGFLVTLEIHRQYFRKNKKHLHRQNIKNYIIAWRPEKTERKFLWKNGIKQLLGHRKWRTKQNVEKLVSGSWRRCLKRFKKLHLYNYNHYSIVQTCLHTTGNDFTYNIRLK